jgi:hypothetical protein
MVTAAPGLPIVGVNEVTVGVWERPTVKNSVLFTEPDGVVTVIGPVVAPDGTAVTISVTDADVTLAGRPLKATVSCVAVALNPVPKIFTMVEAEPLLGVNWMMETCELL